MLQPQLLTDQEAWKGSLREGKEKSGGGEAAKSGEHYFCLSALWDHDKG